LKQLARHEPPQTVEYLNPVAVESMALCQLLVLGLLYLHHQNIPVYLLVHLLFVATLEFLLFLSSNILSAMDHCPFLQSKVFYAEYQSKEHLIYFWQQNF